MAIQAPGRRGVFRVFWKKPALAARALPSTAPVGTARRTSNVGLSMTSMIDVLVVLTVFLLLTFTSSGECGCIRDLSRLPVSSNVEDILEAPIVHVTEAGIMLDGTFVARRDDFFSMTARAQRIDDLFIALKQKHETAKMVSPNRPPPTHVVLAIDGDVPAGVVKSVVLTASRSGYPSIDFMVHAGSPRG